MNIDYKKLATPMDYQWRVQSSRKTGCNCVSYIDARQAMDRLDGVVGPENWCNRYENINGNLYCHVGIKDETGTMIFKSDCGVESNIEQEKGQASDAFKRACVHWGIGRFLYSMGTVWIKTMNAGYKDRQGNDIFKPIHDIQNKYLKPCPPHLLRKGNDGKPGIFINEFRMNDYINQVMGK